MQNFSKLVQGWKDALWIRNVEGVRSVDRMPSGRVCVMKAGERFYDLEKMILKQLESKINQQLVRKTNAK